MRALISVVSRFVPRHRLQRFAHLGMQAIAFAYRGDRFTDPIDGRNYRKLLPYGRVRTRENALAPWSMSLERHRAVWVYLKEHSNLFTSPGTMLHMAPEYCFLKRLSSAQGMKVVRGDLNSPWADIHFDVHDIPFEDGHFDVLMANHLMEHVADDASVFREFYRVMKPGGWGIFQVPMDRSNPHTEEDPTVTDPAERERLYWQRDHVRLYGLDYVDRMTAAGFEAEEVDMLSLLGEERYRKYALGEERYLHVVRKPLN
ncbi:MAG: class I SAM-dependent methyltransferase [Flavobacteriales bacterium]|nr:class I SAM-dependent methyltransferase [Flavobacteriales bacterium]